MSTAKAQPSACGPRSSHRNSGTPKSREKLSRFGIVRISALAFEARSGVEFTARPRSDVWLMFAADRLARDADPPPTGARGRISVNRSLLPNPDNTTKKRRDPPQKQGGTRH